MTKNNWQNILEDRSLLLLEEAGVFFFIVSVIIADLSDVFFWICISLAATLEILMFLRFYFLVSNKSGVRRDRFPRFLLLWQFLFLGFFYLHRSQDLPRIWISAGIIFVTVVHILFLFKEILKQPRGK